MLLILFIQILGVTKRLHFMKTETFLTHIIIPLLNPSPDYSLLKYLTYLTKVSIFFFIIKNNYLKCHFGSILWKTVKL